MSTRTSSYIGNPVMLLLEVLYRDYVTEVVLYSILVWNCS